MINHRTSSLQISSEVCQEVVGRCSLGSKESQREVHHKYVTKVLVINHRTSRLQISSEICQAVIGRYSLSFKESQREGCLKYVTTCTDLSTGSPVHVPVIRLQHVETCHQGGSPVHVPV